MMARSCIPARPRVARKRRLLRDTRGVAALEFALIAPFFFFMVMGLGVLSQAARVSMQLTSAAESMANIVASQQAVTGGTAGTLHDYCIGTQLMLLPYDLTKLSMSVTSYTMHSGVARKDWEYDMRNGNGTPCGGGGSSQDSSVQTLATNLLTPTDGTAPIEGDSVIVVQGNYAFAGGLAAVLPSMNAGISSLTLKQFSYARPRYTVTTPTYFSTVVCASGCSG